jgi:hypothetical protein
VKESPISEPWPLAWKMDEMLWMRRTKFLLSCSFPPRSGAPGYSQSRSTPSNPPFHTEFAQIIRKCCTFSLSARQISPDGLGVRIVIRECPATNGYPYLQPRCFLLQVTNLGYSRLAHIWHRHNLECLGFDVCKGQVEMS